MCKIWWPCFAPPGPRAKLELDGNSVNAVDIAVVVVLLASGVFALMRGFVYEALAMTGWVLAGLAAFWGLPSIRPLVHNYISNNTIADVAGGAGIFLVVLVVCSFITHAVSRSVRGSAVSSVDRSLGFAFGLVRGLVLASLCFILVGKLMAGEPEVLTEAKSRPLLVACATFMESLVPAQLSGMEEKARQAGEAAANDAKNAAYDRMLNPKPKADPAKPDNAAAKSPTYDNSGLERLIDNTK